MARTVLKARPVLPANTIAGDLRHLTPAEIAQMLHMGRKTARVSLRSGDRYGCLAFENGAARLARTGSLHGEEAFYAMLTWEQGDFVIEHDATEAERNLDADTMMLVMEGLRRMDEAGRVSSADGSAEQPEPVGYAAVEGTRRSRPVRRLRRWLSLLGGAPLP